MSSFQKCLPFNLSRMTNSNRVMLGCQHRIDAKNFMTSAKAWRNQHYGQLKADVVTAKLVLDNNPDDDEAKALYEEAVRSRDTYRNDIYTDDSCTEHRQKEFKDIVMAMTCPLVSVGKNDPSDADKSFHPFRCCLGRCDPCRTRQLMIPPTGGETDDPRRPSQ